MFVWRCALSSFGPADEQGSYGHASGYDHGLQADGEHTDVWHVPDAKQPRRCLRDRGGDGGADANAVRTDDVCAMGAGIPDGDDRQLAGADGFVQVYVPVGD
jgi:hypothetical protein